MLRFDVWNSYYEPHFTVDFIYLFSVSDLKIYKLPSCCCFLFILRWNTHTHTRVKLHWDTKCHNPKNHLQVNCWQREGLRCWLPVHPARQRPPSFRFSWASSVSRVLCQWNEVFSAAGPPGLQPTSSARRPRRGRFPASLPRGRRAREALRTHPPPWRRAWRWPSWQLRYIKQS